MNQIHCASSSFNPHFLGSMTDLCVLRLYNSHSYSEKKRFQSGTQNQMSSKRLIEPSRILEIRLNSSHTHVLLITNSNTFYVFNYQKKTFLHEGTHGFTLMTKEPIQCGCLLDQSNVVCLGSAKEFFMWNLKHNEPIEDTRTNVFKSHKQVLSSLKFTEKDEIIGIRICKDFFVIIFLYGLFVYDNEFKVIYRHKSGRNELGLCAIQHHVLAWPGEKIGTVVVQTESKKNQKHIIEAHNNELTCLSLSLRGTHLATASTSGTLIRIFDTVSGSCLKVLRRGQWRKALIHSINFSSNLKYLCCVSGSGTLHIFSLSKNGQINGKSILASLGVIGVTKFEHDWSFAKFFDENLKHHSVASFDSMDASIVHVVTSNGMYYRIQFNYDQLSAGKNVEGKVLKKERIICMQME